MVTRGEVRFRSRLNLTMNLSELREPVWKVAALPILKCSDCSCRREERDFFRSTFVCRRSSSNSNNKVAYARTIISAEL